MGSFSQFTYKNVAPGSENAIKLDDFLDDAGKYLNDKKTPSGRSYSEIQATTFWRAAYVIKNFAYQDALNAYSNIYGKDIVNVTESQAYDQTNDAVWYLMKTYGIRDNKNSSVPWNNSLEEQLYNTAVSGNTQVLRAAPTEKEIKVTGGNQFVYNDATKVWETGTLTLTAPVQHDFILSLPAGITTETGSTVIKTGESFVLKTNVKPAKNSTATISVLARKGKQSEGAEAEECVAAMLMAVSMMFLRFLVLIGIFSKETLFIIWPYMLIMSLVAFLVGIRIHMRNRQRLAEAVKFEDNTDSSNPLEFKVALIFALLFVVFTLITHYTLVYAGNNGLHVLSVIAGLSDITPFILNLLESTSSIMVAVVAACSMQAIISNICVNMCYALFFSGGNKEMKPLILRSFGIVIAANLVMLAVHYLV